MGRRICYSVTTCVVVLCFGQGVVEAGYIDLNSGAGNFNLGAGSEVGGRAISFKVNQTFEISSVGIFAGLVNQSYDAAIFSSTDGNNNTGLITSVSGTTGGTGYGWNDISVPFTFNSGSYYIINWRATDGGIGDWVDGSTLGMNFYDNADLPVTVGPVTLINGFDGYGGGGGNLLHPNIRVNIVNSVVPEPSTFALLGIGGIALAGYGWRCKRQQAT